MQNICRIKRASLKYRRNFLFRFKRIKMAASLFNKNRSFSKQKIKNAKRPTLKSEQV